MSKVAKERASRLREFTDAHQEFQETGSREAVERRNAAMRKGSPEDFARAGQQLADVAAKEGRDRRERMRESQYRRRS